MKFSGWMCDWPKEEGYYFCKIKPDGETEVVQCEYDADAKEGFTPEEMEEDSGIEEKCWIISRCSIHNGCGPYDYYKREDFLWGERIEMP